MGTKNLCPSATANLLACHSVIHSFVENIYELAHIRSNWSVEYSESLKEKIHDVLKNHLVGGLSSFDSEKLNTWRELMIGSLTDLGVVRASVKTDFKDDKAFLKDFFARMGYSDYFSDAKNGDHPAMFNLIMTFAANLTPEIRVQITKYGLDPHCIDRIVENAGALEQYKGCFNMMGDTEIVDKEGQECLNRLYGEIRDICRIATAYYHFDPAKRDAFNFLKAVRNL